MTNDRQLACAKIQSQEGQDYLAAMAAAANYAWVNRSSMTFLARQVSSSAVGEPSWPDRGGEGAAVALQVRGGRG